MNKHFLHILLLISTLIVSNQVLGQHRRVPAGLAKYKYFQIPGKIKMDSGDPEGTIVNLINLDSKLTEKTVNVTSAGKFDLDLEYFKDYRISVSKTGYYQKDIDISTIIPR